MFFTENAQKTAAPDEKHKKHGLQKVLDVFLESKHGCLLKSLRVLDPGAIFVEIAHCQACAVAGSINGLKTEGLVQFWVLGLGF